MKFNFEQIEQKQPNFLVNQLERVNQYRFEHGQDPIDFKHDDFYLSKEELKIKYRDKYEEYLTTLRIIRKSENQEVKDLKLGVWDKINKLLKNYPRTTYLTKLYKHDKRAIKEFEEKIDEYASNPEFKTFLESQETETKISKEALKSYIFDWLKQKYSTEKQQYTEEAVLMESETLKLPPGSSNTEILETSFTAKYAKRWDENRIALDGVQNHLPSDSGGTEVEIKFLVDDQWISFSRLGKTPNHKIKAVKFEDDGKGFDSKLLKYAHSHNKDNKESVGEFGEGLKMLCVAALNHGMQVKLSSRNWVAEPSLKSDTVDRDEIQFLQFKVNSYDDYSRTGSETVFTDLNDRFIDEVRGIKTKILTLDEGYTPLETTTHGEIVREKDSFIYVKGVFTKQQKNPPCLFSYNIFDIQLDRDRSKPEEESLKKSIADILRQTNSKEIMLAMLDWSVQNPASYFIGRGGGGSDSRTGIFEFDECWLHFNNSELLKTAFYEKFGDEAVVSSCEDLTRKAKEKGHSPIKLNYILADCLRNAGVKFDWDLIEREDSEMIETSITLDYEKGKWGIDRIVLDGIQNHLPSDSGGTEVKVEFLANDFRGSKEETWLPLSEIGNYENSQIKGVRFSDDGRGFDVNNLRLLVSSKSQNVKSVGQFGEGMKMAAAACLRNGIEQTLESRNWQAVPFSKRIDLDGKKVDQLRFSTKTFPDREPMKGSSTTYKNISDNFISEVRNIGDKVLFLNPDYQALSSTEKGDIVCTGGGRIFVKGFQVTDREKDNLMFSYDLPLDTSRDREMLEVNSLKTRIKEVLGKTDNLEIVKHLLKTAESNHDAGYFEFQDVSDSSCFKNQQIWLNAFEEIYGADKVVLKSNNKNDWASIEASFIGYKVVTLNSKIAETMRACGILYDYEVAHAETEFSWINQDQLENNELAILNLSGLIDEILEADGENTIPIKVYEKAVNKKNNKEQPTAGFYNRQENFIGIKRSELALLVKFLNTYLEEKAHQMSGGNDGSRELFDYVTAKLAVYIIKDVDQKKE